MREHVYRVNRSTGRSRLTACMTPPRPELDAITATTLAHYDANARTTSSAARSDHDVTQNLAALMRHIDGAAAVDDPRLRLRTGPRPEDDRGAWATSRSDSTAREAFVRRGPARPTGATVLHQNFVDLDLPTGTYDEICANASLQHVPRAVLPEVLCKLRDGARCRAACCSRRSRAATTRRDGTARVTASITTLTAGDASSARPASSSSSTSIARPAVRSTSSAGWRASGAATSRSAGGTSAGAITVRIARLPAPAVDAHPFEPVLRGPAELRRGQVDARIAARDVARPPRADRMRDRASGRGLERGDHLAHRCCRDRSRG